LIKRLEAQENQNKKSEETILKMEKTLHSAVERGNLKQAPEEFQPSQIYADYRVVFQRFVTVRFDENPVASRTSRDTMVKQFIENSNLDDSPHLFNFFKGKLDDTWKGKKSYLKRKVRRMMLAKTLVPSLATLQEDEDKEIEKMWNRLLKDQEINDLTEQIGTGQNWSEEYQKFIQACVKSFVKEEKHEWNRDNAEYLENLPLRRQEAKSPK